MKIFALVLATVFSANIFASPARQATVVCSFLKFIDSKGQVTINEWTDLAFNVDLDTGYATLICGKDPDTCPLDGNSTKLKVTSTHNSNESFKPIANNNGRFRTYSSNLSPINLEGSNNDDMDLFFRISFEAESETELSATAIMTYADEGVNGIVSVPSSCLVK
jgi:hypothetical protein